MAVRLLARSLPSFRMTSWPSLPPCNGRSIRSLATVRLLTGRASVGLPASAALTRALNLFLASCRGLSVNLILQPDGLARFYSATVLNLAWPAIAAQQLRTRVSALVILKCEMAPDFS